MKRRTFIATLPALGLLSTRSGLSLANSSTGRYPNKPVKAIVPAMAGSGPDTMSRILWDQISTRMGQPFVIENRPGAGGNIGFDALAKAPADGYNLGMINSSTAINPSLYKKVSYDPLKDFIPLSISFEMPGALVVRSDSNINTVADLIAKLKAEPNKHNYASGGNGSAAHLSAELFKSMTRVDALHVPFKGAPELITAILSGNALFGFPNLSPSIPLIQSGKLKLIAVTGRERVGLFANTPTVAETLPGYEAIVWFGFAAPKNTPPAIVKALEEAIHSSLQDPQMKERMFKEGSVIANLQGAQAVAYIEQDMKKWRQVIEVSKAQVD